MGPRNMKLGAAKDEGPTGDLGVQGRAWLQAPSKRTCGKIHKRHLEVVQKGSRGPDPTITVQGKGPESSASLQGTERSPDIIVH